MNSPAIRVTNLTKTFVSQTQGLKAVKALDGVDIEISSGEILGILGPNGAGKTTFLNILSTLLLPDSGRIEIFGEQLIPRNFGRLRTLLNMSSGNPNFPWSLTVTENLRFYGRLYGLKGKGLQEKVARLIEMFGLGRFAEQRFDELSSGTKQKLALAKALLNDPKIVFLDEPTVGLDPDAAIKIRQIISDIRKFSITILLTTHNMHEAELMCQRIAFIKAGRILKLATPQELKAAKGKKNLEEVFVDLVQEKAEVPGRTAVKTSLPAPEEMRAKAGPAQTPVTLLSAAAAWLNRCFAFTYRNFLFSMRNVFAFVELIFWPIVSLVSMGLLGDYLQLQEKALGFILTGAITAGILQVTQLDVAYSLLYEVWSKSVKHTFLTPVGTSEYLFGSWVIGIVRGGIIFCILSAAAMFFFDFRFPAAPVVVIFLFGIFCCALLLGFLVTVLILIFGQKAEITAWMFSYLFMLVCGIYYPINTLPKFFYYFAQVLPITYFLEYFRESFGFTPVLGYSLAKGFGLIVVYLAAGLKAIDFAFYQARKKGTIVRLSE